MLVNQPSGTSKARTTRDPGRLTSAYIGNALRDSLDEHPEPADRDDPGTDREHVTPVGRRTEPSRKQVQDRETGRDDRELPQLDADVEAEQRYDHIMWRK